MLLIQRLAEEKILTAIEQGEFDDLPGQGKPLVLDDNAAVPEELRAGYRLLKNSGYLPLELELRKEIQHVEELLCHVENNDQENYFMQRLLLLKNRLAKHGHTVSLVVEEGKYREKLAQRMSRKIDERSVSS